MNTVYVNKELCSGCGACSHSCRFNAIEMQEDSEGFIYPYINQELCVNCGKCKQVCPFVKEKAEDSQPKVYAVKNISDEVRKNSASGGVFTAISDYILKQGGVVYGVVFGEKLCVEHVRATTTEERDAMLGSKYVQSNLGDIFLKVEQDLKDNKLTLFSGTPCQIAGLKAYLGIEYNNLLLCDIICHGVGSTRVFRDYISFLEHKNDSKVKNICFRDKEQGWSRQKWKVILMSGEILRDNRDVNVYKKLYYSHVMQRPSCHKCPYTQIKRQGDITIGDYWGINNSHPDFMNELGVSVVLLNTEKGANCFEQIQGSITCIKSEISNCLQPQLQFPAAKSKKRDLFWRKYEKRGFKYIAKKFGTVSLHVRVVRKIRNMIK